VSRHVAGYAGSNRAVIHNERLVGPLGDDDLGLTQDVVEVLTVPGLEAPDDQSAG
jgi:hypothetical protein